MNVTVELALLMFVHWLLFFIIHVILFIYALFIKLRLSRTNNKAFLCASLVLNYICSVNRSEIYILRQMFVLIPITLLSMVLYLAKCISQTTQTFH